MRSRNVHVQLWLNEKEAAMLKKNVKAAGITQSAYLRHLIKGFVPKEHPPLDYFSFMRSLYSLANNLNQIAQKAHVLGVIDAKRYDKYAGVVIVMEGTYGHPMMVHCQPIVFCRLAGCDEAFDAFEVNHLFTSFLCSEK